MAPENAVIPPGNAFKMLLEMLKIIFGRGASPPAPPPPPDQGAALDLQGA